MVYGEVADSIQGAPQPLYKRPRFFADSQWHAYAGRLTAFAHHTLAHGVRVAYHHHMGAYVETPADVDALMARVGDAVGLLFDTGHMTFAGGDAAQMLAKHVAARLPCPLQGRAAGGDRARAQPQLELSRIRDQWRLHRAGRRRHRFRGRGQVLRDHGYQGWLVVEAEQDPVVAPSYAYADKGYRHLHELVNAGDRV